MDDGNASADDDGAKFSDVRSYSPSNASESDAAAGANADSNANSLTRDILSQESVPGFSGVVLTRPETAPAAAPSGADTGVDMAAALRTLEAALAASVAAGMDASARASATPSVSACMSTSAVDTKAAAAALAALADAADASAARAEASAAAAGAAAAAARSVGADAAAADTARAASLLYQTGEYGRFVLGLRARLASDTTFTVAAAAQAQALGDRDGPGGVQMQELVASLACLQPAGLGLRPGQSGKTEPEALENAAAVRAALVKSLAEALERAATADSEAAHWEWLESEARSPGC
jgi:hypothetical protein